MTLGDRERRLLGVLVLALVALGAYRLWPLLRPGDSLGDDAGGGPRANAAKVDLPALRSADLEIVSGSFVPGRDPFRFGAPPPPPAPPPPTKAELEAMRKRQQEDEAARQAADRARQIEAGRPHPPAVDYLKFLGSFGPKNHRIAVFSDGKTIYNAAEGEVIDRKFVVDKIGYESVDLKFVGFPDEPPARLAAGGQS